MFKTLTNIDVLFSFWKLWEIPGGSEELWRGSGGFQKALEASESLRRVLRGSAPAASWALWKGFAGILQRGPQDYAAVYVL